MFRALRRFAATLRARLSMPLLRKELVETAARRRTYILRVTYALVLYVVFGLTIPSHAGFSDMAGSELRTSLLGFGRNLFNQLILLQVIGVALFQPALMCGRITQEKERDSLVLLFLTELRPWEIILQKYIGGLLPMFSFLLLGLPLAGVAYAFGGMEAQMIVESCYTLVVITMQAGAIALLCSAWCRTTVSALISTYVLGAIFYAGPPLLGTFLAKHGAFTVENYRDPELFIVLFPPAALSVARSYPVMWPAVFVPSIGSIAIFLLLARFFLIRRAFVPAGNFLPRLFARIDGFMKRANRLTGGVMLLRDAGSLPADDPVFWRDTHRRALGKPHHLLRLLCAIEIPTVLVCMLVALSGNGTFDSGVIVVAAAVLGILVLFSLSATAANAIVSERVGQSLEVLLTTPLGGWEIIRQKERALRRLEWVLAVPLLTVFACHAAASEGNFIWARREWNWVLYMTCTAFCTLIYLPMVTWLSLWIGMRVRTRFQAIIAALGTVTCWAALAPLLFSILDRSEFRDKGLGWLLLASPVSVPVLNEFNTLYLIDENISPWFIIAFNAALYSIIAFVIRLILIRDAERCLRR